MPAAAPTVVSVTPASANQGQSVSVIVQGTNFVQGATSVAVSGAGVTVSGVQVVSATSLVATFASAATADPGAHDVTVTTPDGPSSPTAFTVNPVLVPTLTAISVPNGGLGQVVSITLTGTNFVVGGTVVNVAGIGVSNVNVGSSTSLTATLTIPTGATVGNHPVSVTTAGGTSPTTVAFNVFGAPTLTSLSSNTAFKGSTANYTFTGTNFVFGATDVTVTPPTGVTVSVVNSTSSTARTVSLAVDIGAAAGPRLVKVTTPSGPSGQLTLNVVGAQGYTVSTIAGGGVTNGGTATAQTLPEMRDVARDSQGNVYIAAPAASRIYKVTPAGVISIFAGNGIPGTSGDGGLAVNAQVLTVASITVDPSDNVIYVDANGLRKISTNGTITSIAGKGSTTVFTSQIGGAFGGDGGPAAWAWFSPGGVSSDSAGNLYVTDTGNNRIRKITPAGIVSTVAGNGTAGFSGDNGPATDAQLALDTDTTKVAVDAAGNIYIPDSNNHRIRKVTAADGKIATIAGTGTGTFSGDGAAAVAAALNFPSAVAIDGAGNLYIADQGNLRIRKIGTDGNINTIAGTGDFIFNGDGATATSKNLYPFSLTSDTSGNVYFIDGASNRVRKVATSGAISTIAGNTGVFSPDGSLATQTGLYFPSGVAVDASGGILITDAANARVRRINPGDGTMTTIAGNGSVTISGEGGPAVSAGLGLPIGVAVAPSGVVYISAETLDLGGTDSRVWKIALDGTISTVAGGATSAFSGENVLATTAQLNNPNGLVVDPAGNLYIADTDNNRVRRINASDGKIVTIAGTGVPGYNGDNIPATTAQLSHPEKLALDSSGNLYITDHGNNRVRKVATDQTITTFNTPATEVRGVAAGNGAVFVSSANRITRFIDGGGAEVIAGYGGSGTAGDGGAGLLAMVNPYSMAVTASGAIVFTDEDNQVVRRLTPVSAGSAVLSTFFGGVYYRAGEGTAPLVLNFPITLDGDGTFLWNAAANVATPGGGTWLSLSPASGTGTGATTVTLNPVGLAPGDYNGSITVTAASAVNSPLVLPVTLTIMPALIGTTSGSLTLAGTAGGFLTTSAVLGVINTGSSDMNLTLAPSVITPGGGSWFTGLTTTSLTLPRSNTFLIAPVVNLAGLAAGAYRGAITITSPDAVNSPVVVPVFLNLTASAAPTLTSITPVNASQAQTANVTFTGTNFVNGATVTPSGTGVSVAAVTVNSAVSLTATLVIAPGAPAVPGTVTVTTPSGTTATQAFTVLGPPTLTSVAPNNSTPGRTLTVTLTGTNFSQNATLASISGSGVTVSNVVAATSTTARTATLTIAPNATPGIRTLTVTTPAGTSGTVNFGVTSPANSLISTYAGQSVITEGGSATAQPLPLMSDAAMDSSGNLYIAATYGNKVFKVTPAGVLTTFAGTGIAGPAGDGGPAAAAQLFFPRSILVDANNNVLIADSSNNRIRKVATDGTITTLAGTGGAGFTGDGGPALFATLNFPTAMGLDPAGNLYVYDLNNRRLRKIDTAGVITTVAGSGTFGFFGDGLQALLAQFNVDGQAAKLAIDGSGNIYIPDTANHRIRKVAANGIVSTVAGNGTASFSGDNGPATSAMINAPRGVALDASGNLLISDANNNRIRKITGGTISTILGNGGYGFNGDGATPLARQLSNPLGLFADAAGNVYFSDQGSNRIRQLSPGGTLTTIAGNGGVFDGATEPVGASKLYQPNAIAFDTGGNMLIADSRNYQIRKVDGSGNITTIAGTGVNGTSPDGTLATAAQIGFVNDIAVDTAGNIYITVANRIRKINASDGKINTIAGTGVGGNATGDGGLATLAVFNNPSGLAIDPSGNIYVADFFNHRVRKINASDGVINTIAGTGTFGFSGDGFPATTAQLNSPNKLALDSAGNLYIGDGGNNRIRIVALNQTINTFSTAGGAAVTFNGGSIYLSSPSLITQVLSDGSVATLAGFSTTGISGDGGPALMASLSISALAVSPAGTVYFADGADNVVRKLTPVSAGSAVLSVSPTGINTRLGNTTSQSTTTTISLNGSGTFTWTATPTLTSAPDKQWLTVSPAGGTGGAPLLVTVNAAGLAAGFYRGSVTIASPQSANGSVVVPVTLTVLPSILSTSVSSLTPAATAGGANPAAAIFTVSNGGSGPSIPYTADVVTSPPGGTWLSVAPPSANTNSVLTVTYNTTGLASGVYTGGIRIASGSASNSPVVVPVTLTLTPNAAPTLSSINPSSGLQGQILTVVLTGTNFAPTGNTVAVSGTGVTVGTVGLVSPTQLGAVFTVAAGALAADHTVTVTTPSGTSNGVIFASTAPASTTTGYTISTVAGRSVITEGGTATAQPLPWLWDAALDSQGNVYIAGLGGNKVFKVTAAGAISTFAGTGIAGSAGDGGPATAAQLNSPGAVIVDGNGNVLIADRGNHRIRKVASNGTITTIAGTGSASFGGDGGPAIFAPLSTPSGLGIDSAGNVYIIDAGNRRIRKVDTNGVITTVAGNGSIGFSGDGQQAILAQLSLWDGFTPKLSVDSSGNLYIPDTFNNRIRKVATNGIISTIAGTGACCFSGDGGPAVNAFISGPRATIVDGSGNLFISDSSNSRIRKIASGTITTIAGNGGYNFDGDGANALSLSLSPPIGLALDGTGNLYIASPIHTRIRKLSPAGALSTVAGSGGVFAGDGGAATGATLANPNGIIFDAGGNLVIADSRNYRIRKVDGSGNIATIVGTGVPGTSPDGTTATAAQIGFVFDMAYDAAGNLYIATDDNRVRKIGTNGLISTIAGTGVAAFGGDGGPATSAQLSSPQGLAIDTSGNIYVSDAGNHRIRKITASNGNISTIAGTGTAGSAGGTVSVGDGGPATAAQLNTPRKLAFDAAGNLYASDGNNSRIRKIATDQTISTFSNFGVAAIALGGGTMAVANGGQIQLVFSDLTTLTIAGNGGGFSGDNGSALTASLTPGGLGVSPAGVLYMVDSQNNVVRKLTTSSPGSAVLSTSTTGIYSRVAPSSSTNVNLGVVLNGSGVFNWGAASAMTTPVGGSWLSISPAAGTNNGTVTVTMNSSGLAAGSYAGSVTITSAQAVNAQVVVPVTMTVLPTALLSPTVSSLTTSGIVGGANPVSQLFVLNNSVTNNPVAFTAAPVVTTPPGGTWLSVSPTSGNTGNTLTVSFNISGLGSGIYTGGIQLTSASAGNSGIIVPVTLTLTPSAAPTLTSLTPSSGPQNSSVNVTLTGTNFNPSGPNTVNIGGTGVILIGTPAYINGTTLTAVFGVAPAILIGDRNVSVTTSNGTSNALPFTVTAPPATTTGYTISTYAGQSSVTEGAAATAQALPLVSDAAMDASGNIYIAATYGNKIYKVTSGGVITTFAGTGVAGPSGDGGFATAAQLSVPRAVRVDANNNVLIADTGNNRIRKVAPNGTITTFAGTGAFGFSGDGGPAQFATLAGPSGLGIDSAGNVYIVDVNNRRIRKVAANGVITTVAGNGTNGFSGEGVPAITAQFSFDGQTTRVAIDSSGNIYIPDQPNHRVRKVASDGTVTTIAGNGTASFSGDNGPAVNATLNSPRAVALDTNGNLLISDSGNNRIRKISGGNISTIAGNGGIGFNGDGPNPTTTIQLSNPLGLAVDGSGNVLFADQGSNRIRLLSTSGAISTVAGNGGLFGGDAGPVGASVLYQPSDLAFDPSGNLLITDSRNYQVRKVDTGGTITTIAGTGVNGVSPDGTLATAAQIGFINALAIDAAGNIYIAQQNQRVSKVNASDGKIYSIAGGVTGSAGDGGPATLAQFRQPMGVAFDTSGNIYIADANNHRVRKINASDGVINTIAGTGTAGNLGDGGPAASAQLNFPRRLAFDSAGNLYIATNGGIRKIAPNQTISTVSGLGGGNVVVSGSNVFASSGTQIQQLFSNGTSLTLAGNSAGISANGTAALNASTSLQGLAVSPGGVIYFADGSDNVVRRLNAVAAGSAILSTSVIGGIHVQAGAGSSTGFGVGITLDGSGVFSWSATSSVTTPVGGSWLSLAPANGTGNNTVGLTMNTAGLAVGVYNGSVTITSPQAANGSVVIPVTLAVIPASLLSTSSSILTTSATAGGANPTSQILTISNSSSGPAFGFTSSALVTTPSGGTWLSVSPGSANTGGTLTVSFNIAGLAAGVYTGSVQVAAAGAANTPLAIPVILTIAPGTAKRVPGQITSQ